MYREALEVLRFQGRPLDLHVTREADGRVVEGYLSAGDEWFPIEGGVPCFLTGGLRPDLSEFARRHGLRDRAGARPGERSGQAETAATFSYKWEKFQAYGDRPEEREFLASWYGKKLGVPGGVDALRDFYRRFDRVLEVGPGSGFNTRFIAESGSGQVFALDISAAALTTFAKVRHLANATVIQADLNEAPFPDDCFDLVVADGVLHHTPSTEQALRNLYRHVKPGGTLFFHVYRKMGAVRQFSDAYIRERFTELSPEECLEACRSLTELGRELSRLNARITLERPIEVLGIPAGTHDVQRLIYYGVVKCFWNEAFEYDVNNLVNFDWYHPRYAWQHTEDEVAGWLRELGVQDYVFHDANPNGISCLLIKPGPRRP